LINDDDDIVHRVQLCKELMRFLFSLDHTGTILTKALQEAGLALDWPVPTATADDPSLQSAPNPC
jgi:hypothetical protein